MFQHTTTSGSLIFRLLIHIWNHYKSNNKKSTAYLISVQTARFYGFDHRDFGAPTSHVYRSGQRELSMRLRNYLICEKFLKHCRIPTHDPRSRDHRRHGLSALLWFVATINLTPFQRSRNLLCCLGSTLVKNKTRVYTGNWLLEQKWHQQLIIQLIISHRFISLELKKIKNILKQILFSYYWQPNFLCYYL